MILKENSRLIINLTKTKEHGKIKCDKYWPSEVGESFTFEENEQKTVIVQQRSLRAKFDLKKGQIINREMLDILRPCPEKDVKPNRLDEVIGKTVLRDISIGDCIFEQDIE